MRNIWKASLAAMLALGLAACSSSEPETSDTTEEETKEEETKEETAEPETAVASYYIINNTGEKATWSIVNNEGELETKEGELEDGKYEAVDFGEVKADLSFTVNYKTESGREGKFETLHVEEANISLLAEDDMTGSTQIAFVQELPVTNAKAAYVVTNNTGEKVTLTISNNEGELDAFEKELADGESVDVDFGEVNDTLSFTVNYKTESGREGKFETLHVEEANISLLAEDDMTGPTQIAFTH